MENCYERVRPTTLNPDPSSHDRVRKPDTVQQATRGTLWAPPGLCSDDHTQETEVWAPLSCPTETPPAKALARRPRFLSKHSNGGGRREARADSRGPRLQATNEGVRQHSGLAATVPRYNHDSAAEICERVVHEQSCRCDGLVSGICFQTGQATVGAGRGGRAGATWRK